MIFGTNGFIGVCSGARRKLVFIPIGLNALGDDFELWPVGVVDLGQGVRIQGEDYEGFAEGRTGHGIQTTAVVGTDFETSEEGEITILPKMLPQTGKDYTTKDDPYPFLFGGADAALFDFETYAVGPITNLPVIVTKHYTTETPGYFYNTPGLIYTDFESEADGSETFTVSVGKDTPAQPSPITKVL